LARRHVDRGWCTGEHALPVAATDGQLCGEHFLAAFGREVMPTHV
jgi:hypothetical protein